MCGLREMSSPYIGHSPILASQEQVPLKVIEPYPYISYYELHIAFTVSVVLMQTIQIDDLGMNPKVNCSPDDSGALVPSAITWVDSCKTLW